MLIECPECHHAHTLTTEQFQNCDGITKCPDCSAEFDPLANLSETNTEPEPQKSIDPEPLPDFAWNKNRKSLSSSFWSYGSIAGICLLSFQVFYFRHSEWVQSATLRPLLEKTCAALKCKLPIYNNIDEINILHSSFLEHNQKYTLQAAIKNQSEFSQRIPNLKLTLLNFSGTPIAKRFFKPEQYLEIKDSSDVLKKSETLTIKLEIQMPNVKIGGFTIGLI